MRSADMRVGITVYDVLGPATFDFIESGLPMHDDRRRPNDLLV